MNEEKRHTEEKKNMYRRVDESVVRRLIEIAGPKAVFTVEDQFR
jgi:hypothetical protein